MQCELWIQKPGSLPLIFHGIESNIQPSLHRRGAFPQIGFGTICFIFHLRVAFKLVACQSLNRRQVHQCGPALIHPLTFPREGQLIGPFSMPP